MPDEPEALGLLALMLLTDARRPARTDADGDARAPRRPGPHPLGPATLIAEGHASCARCLRRNQPGPFQIQAAITAVHADAPTAASTDWGQIVALYDQLLALRPTPVVALNRAVAVAELDGARAAALDSSTASSSPTTSRTTRPAPTCSRRCGRADEARGAYERARELTTNEAERRFLASRLARLT